MKTEIQQKIEQLAYSCTTPFCYGCYIKAPKGVCPKCHSYDRMRYVAGVGCDWSIDFAIKAIIEEKLTPVDTESAFEDMIPSSSPKKPLLDKHLSSIFSALDAFITTFSASHNGLYDICYALYSEVPMKLIHSNSGSKIGRNDPCHCGSGQKYKKCCLGLDQESTRKSMDPTTTKREMERMMGQIGKIVESKNMSIEELNRYFVGRTMDDINDEFEELGGRSEKEKAQDLIFDAMEEPNTRTRRKLIDEALALYPHLPDAWIMMAEEKAETAEDALSYFERAVKAGEEDLGQDFFKENEGHFWGMTETRPYMRAKAYLADALWELGRENEAITHYQDCLRLNPNDNQGIRDVLMSYLLIKNDFIQAEELLKRYKEDIGTQYAFNKTLLLFKKYGRKSKKAEKQIIVAMSKNPYVHKYLLGKLKIPSQIPGQYAIGSKEEAVIYVSEAARAWKETPGAIEWLAQFS